MFLTLVIANIWVAISSAAFGMELMGMERNMKVIAEENKRLMESMVSEQSLQAISSKAHEIGMIEPTEVIYLNASAGLTASR